MTSNRLFGLDGRVAAVIGAGSGIGEAVALAMAPPFAVWTSMPKRRHVRLR